jgi:hypothetical protein
MENTSRSGNIDTTSLAKQNKVYIKSVCVTHRSDSSKAQHVHEPVIMVRNSE